MTVQGPPRPVVAPCWVGALLKVQGGQPTSGLPEVPQAFARAESQVQ
jgi:hypothetical protein